VRLYIDRAGVLWVGTENGLNAFDPKTESFRVYAPPAKPSTLRWISEDSGGGLWLSTGWNGVYRFDPVTAKFTVYRHSNAPGALSSDAANAVCVDRSEIVWVGTQSGLNRLDPATGTATLYNPGQSTISIESILRTRAAICGWARTMAWSGSIRGRRLSGITTHPMGWPLMSFFSAAWKSPGVMYSDPTAA
jgi:streptogramin lyase